MAIIGLILLVGSAFVAAAAPLITPYDPRQTLYSSPFSKPEWVMMFSDGYYLSRNIGVVRDPSFTSPAAVQDWALSTSSSTLANLRLNYAPGNAFNNSVTLAAFALPKSPGSLEMDYSGTTPAKAVISQTFHYPYHGPPKQFAGTILYDVTGATASNPIQLRVFVTRGSDTFTLWAQNATASGFWIPQPLDSGSGSIETAVHAENSLLSPAELIFSQVQDYTLGLEVTFTGNQKVNIDDFQIILLGTAWGIFGTDSAGSDLFSQLVYGARISLEVGLLAAFIGIGLGLLIGLMAGFLGPLVDQALMRFTDMLLVLPTLPLLLVLVAVLGANLVVIILVIGLLGWMGFARVIRSQVLSLKERPFIEAARAAGSGPMRSMFVHVFPNIIGLTYVNLALSVPAAILTEAALEFLGLGDPNVISWGHTFYNAESSDALFTWWWVLPPGIAIALVSLSFVFIGYSLDELFNPKLRRRQ